MKLYDAFKIKSIAIIDKDKKNRYAHIANVFFAKGNDFEEDVYDNFTLIDYMRYNDRVENINAFVGILKRYGIILDISLFKTNPDRLAISKSLQQQIMTDIKASGLTTLRKTKNASKATLLAEYVTTVPKSFQKIINKLKAEVK